MEIYAMPILEESGEIKWVHAKDFNPEINKCFCPQCQINRIPSRKLINPNKEIDNANRSQIKETQ